MLDLKYRPTKFSQVLGNDGVKKLLLIRSRQRTLTNQSMMFGGPKGCGKTTMARIAARAIFCKNLEDGEPCGKCHDCISILDENHPSVTELDAASQGTIDRIREMVDNTNYNDFQGNSDQVYIVDEAHRLSKNAQDAFLKSIENRLFTIILCTTEPHKIQGPIRDRVEEYPVRGPSDEELLLHLKEISGKENIHIEDECVYPLIMKMNENTPRSCILTLENLSSLGTITRSVVEDHFRFNSFKLVNSILTNLDSDLKSSFKDLTTLSKFESPTWIRDSIILAISSGLREEIGSKSSFPVPITFFGNRKRGWVEVAKDLGLILRPTIYDIESILLKDCLKIPTVKITEVVEEKVIKNTLDVEEKTELPERVLTPNHTSEPSLDTSKPKENMTTEKPNPPNKSIVIDGVSFSGSESLTSLDDKIRGRDDDDVGESNEPLVGDSLVKLDKSRAPISEKEFANRFKSRLKL